MKVAIGVDPGISGALAVVDSDGMLVHHMMFPGTWSPVYDYLIKLSMKYTIIAGVEKVAAVPGNGVKSLFSFGGNVGGWKAVLELSRTPHIEVAPAAWQPKILGSFPKGESKKAALNYVAKRYPDLKLLKEEQGVADAICIALYTLHYK